MIKHFWIWYKKNYKLNLAIAAILFLLQSVHLLWLLLHVVLPKLGFYDYFSYFSFLNWPLVLVDYTEIPAIVSVSLVYINELRNKLNIKSIIYLLFINIQWLHLLWITDEFVLETVTFSGFLWWLAIFIDYLEIPVIIDTVGKLLKLIKKGNTKDMLQVLSEN